jgi:cytochrome c oxidase cbb3-type subunit 4
MVSGLVTLLLMLVFIAVWAWAWQPRKRKDFDEAARLAVDDGDQDGMARQEPRA